MATSPTVTRRKPRPLTLEQRLSAENEYLKRELARVVKETNEWAAAKEQEANEAIRISQQAQVDHDQKILAAWQENTAILLEENEQLRLRVEQLNKEVDNWKRKALKNHKPKKHQDE